MKIRRVDTYFGMLFIVIAGAAATFAIIHTIHSIPPEYLANYEAIPGT